MTPPVQGQCVVQEAFVAGVRSLGTSTLHITEVEPSEFILSAQLHGSADHLILAARRKASEARHFKTVEAATNLAGNLCGIKCFSVVTL